MATKRFKRLVEDIRRHDSYWVERTKIEFAEELGRLMERRTVNRSQLAERIGSSAAYVTKALRGDTNFTIESMVKLVRAMDGKLSIHVSAVEDHARWMDLLKFPVCDISTVSFETGLLKPGFRFEIDTDVRSEEIDNGSVSIAA